MPARQRGSPRRARLAAARRNFLRHTGFEIPAWLGPPAPPAAAGGGGAALPPAPTQGRTMLRTAPPLYLPTITKGAPTQARAQMPRAPIVGAPAPTHGQRGAPFGQLGLLGTEPEPETTERPGPPSTARMFGRWGYAMGRVITPEEEEEEPRDYTPPGAAGAPPAEGGGGGGGGGGGRAAAAPPGVNPGWYAEFQRRHGGQTPEEFYAQTGEGLAHALADKEWSEGFAAMYGRPPSDDDWKAHWFSTRVGYQPGERAPRGWRRQARKQAKKEEKKARPPLWAPPAIIWR